MLADLQEAKTPFGDHELGMHVVYVNQINDIFNFWY